VHSSVVEISRAHKTRSDVRLSVISRPARPDRDTSFRILELAMAQVCDVCGKGPQFGNNISHAHNVTRRRWSPNLQAVHALVNGASKRIRVCTNCIKSGKVAKA
jgi:large subunit ribosomal protein L28